MLARMVSASARAATGFRPTRCEGRPDGARVRVRLPGHFVCRQGHGYELAGTGAVSLRLDTHDADRTGHRRRFSRCHGGDVYGARVSCLGSRGFAGKLEAGLLARLRVSAARAAPRQGPPQRPRRLPTAGRMDGVGVAAPQAPLHPTVWQRLVKERSHHTGCRSERRGAACCRTPGSVPRCRSAHKRHRWWIHHMRGRQPAPSVSFA